MKYIIINGADISAFIEVVNSNLIKGWKLQGGICVTEDANDYCTHYQAMTLDEGDTKLNTKGD